MMRAGRGRPISVDVANGLPGVQVPVMEEWGFVAERLIKRGMLQRGWGYRELAEALNAKRIPGSATVINRRINRGNFSAAFLLVCLSILGNESDLVDAVTAKDGVGSSAKGATK
ncbi:hypothetical protein CEW83_07685 [Parazoarcus communis]|uniref:DUF6471 domain-containing protein n=2 Tax=Parazoarcus communis TaxID=41977 RepID=A0A2U8GN89_9RHOO|nr:hypothetical protein CEW83_07685 [Parazoarcus communis]